MTERQSCLKPHLVTVRVSRLRRRSWEHLPPPAQSTPGQQHVGQAEPEGEAHGQCEHELLGEKVVT